MGMRILQNTSSARGSSVTMWKPPVLDFVNIRLKVHCSWVDQDARVGQWSWLPPTNISKTHLRMEQFSPKTNWKLAERPLYNQVWKKDPWGIGLEGKRRDQIRTCAPGRTLRGKGENTETEILPRGWADGGTYWAPRAPWLVGGLMGLSRLWEAWTLLGRTMCSCFYSPNRVERVTETVQVADSFPTTALAGTQLEWANAPAPLHIAAPH